LSQFNRVYLKASAGLLVIAALLHLAAIALGANAYAFLGAPAGLIALIGTGSPRPAASCVVIAGALILGAAFGFSGAGMGPRLPFLRTVLGLFATILVARGILLPAAAAWQPQVLGGICGRCQSLNGFVLLTSASCLFVGIAYALAALRSGANGSSRPAPLRG